MSWGGGGSDVGFRNWERRWLGRRVGLISRLCVHFFLGFASRGSPISLPRSFKPVQIKHLGFRPHFNNTNIIFYITLNILPTNRPLNLSHDLIVGNCFSTLVVCDDLRLLVNFLRKISER